ncbi:hypothetical protein DL93DRAFT_2084697 [Clavulina sp. PMI_390]|nr:hypothetical protein DL93DRAFT_2084697 [Clavulina sp. PMI_390]
MGSINELPVELLSSIFIPICQGFYDFESSTPSWKDDFQLLRTILTLSSVNSLWRDVVFSLPQIWATILVTVDSRWSTGKSARVAQWRLEHSRTSPLTITLRVRGYPDGSQMGDAWGIIVPYLPRCQHLIFTNLLPRFLKTIFPLPGRLFSLKKISIQGPQYSGGGLTEIDRLFSESPRAAAPLLNSLDLGSLPCAPESFGDLSFLKLRLADARPPFRPALALVETYFQRNRTLDTLVILAPPVFTRGTAEFLRDPISFPSLRRLAVKTQFWNWPDIIDAPTVQHLVLTNVYYILGVLAKRFPAVEHISI